MKYDEVIPSIPLIVDIVLQTDGDYSLQDYEALGFYTDDEDYTFYSKHLDTYNIDDFLGSVLENIRVIDSHLYIWRYICEMFFDVFEYTRQLFIGKETDSCLFTMHGNYGGTMIRITPVVDTPNIKNKNRKDVIL